MPGTVSIRPLSAKLTRDTELFGTMDPYCKFQLGKQNVSGQVCKNGGKHPVWDETLVLKRVNEPICHLQLKEHDWLLPDGLIGECNINLNEVENKQRILKWYNLTYTGKPVGQILIELNYDGEKGNQFLAPVPGTTTGQRVEPEYLGHIPSGYTQATTTHNNNQQFPGLTEVHNPNKNMQQGFQPHSNPFNNNNNNHHNEYQYQQQYNPYEGDRQDMFAPPAHENLNSYGQDGQKYPNLEGPYYGNYNSNQAHEVIDYRSQQNNYNDNNFNQQQKYPGVTGEALTHANQQGQEAEGSGWDPVRVIRGALGRK